MRRRKATGQNTVSLRERQSWHQTLFRRMATVFPLILFSFGCAHFARVKEQEKLEKGYTLPAEQVQALKESTTYFFLRARDLKRIGEYKTMIEKAWTFSPVEVVPFTEIPTYIDEPGTSFFGIDVDGYDECENNNPFVDLRDDDDREGCLATITRTALSLNIQAVEVDGKEIEESHTEIALIHLAQSARYTEKEEGDEGIDETGVEVFHGEHAVLRYTEFEYDNWSPAMLHLYLIDLQNDLRKSWRRGWRERNIDEEGLSHLADSTLYVPEHVFERRERDDFMQGKDSKPSEIFADYPYEYKIVTEAELSDLLKTSNETVYVFDFVGVEGASWMTVYSSKDGAIFRAFMGTWAYFMARHVKYLSKFL